MKFRLPEKLVGSFLRNRREALVIKRTRIHNFAEDWRQGKLGKFTFLEARDLDEMVLQIETRLWRRTTFHGRLMVWLTDIAFKGRMRWIVLRESDHLAPGKNWVSPLGWVSVFLPTKHKEQLELAIADTRDKLRERVLAGTLQDRRAKWIFAWRSTVETFAIIGPFVLRVLEVVVKLSKP